MPFPHTFAQHTLSFLQDSAPGSPYLSGMRMFLAASVSGKSISESRVLRWTPGWGVADRQDRGEANFSRVQVQAASQGKEVTQGTQVRIQELRLDSYEGPVQHPASPTHKQHLSASSLFLDSGPEPHHPSTPTSSHALHPCVFLPCPFLPETHIPPHPIVGKKKISFPSKCIVGPEPT